MFKCKYAFVIWGYIFRKCCDTDTQSQSVFTSAVWFKSEKRTRFFHFSPALNTSLPVLSTLSCCPSFPLFHTQQIVSAHTPKIYHIKTVHFPLSVPLSCTSSFSLSLSHTDRKPGPFSAEATVTTNWCSFIASSVYVCLTFKFGC